MAGESTSWELDELAHAGPEHLDPAYVAGYDEKSPTDWSEEVADLLRIVVSTQRAPSSTSAPGRGRSRGRSHRTSRVSWRSTSRRRWSTRCAGGGVEAVRAGFLSYEHRGDPPAAVVTRNALHHLPDFWKAIALERIARLLRPGGVLLLQDIVFSFDPADATEALAEWL